MCQQFMDRHLLPWLGTRRNIRADVIVYLQFALFLQDQYCHGGKLLGRRAEVKHSVWCIGYLLAPVGHAIALAQEYFVIVCDKHRAAELLKCSLMHEQSIDLGGNQGVLRAQGSLCGMHWLLALIIYVNNKLQDEYEQETDNDQYTHAFDEASRAPPCLRVAELIRA